MTKPLDDVTVIEIDSWMAAPSSGAILADLGARVIKIEPLSGDPMRNMGRTPKIDDPVKEHDFQFDIDNRGKESVQLDLTKPEAIEIVNQLCARSEVFLCNLLMKRQQKYKLDPPSLLQVNPRLVHATLTGYGTTGPDAWRPGYDVTAFFGRSGLYDAMREGDDGLVPMARPAQGDHTAGLALVGAILAGLRQAERTGEGQVVETSLYETAVWTQATDYSVTAVDRAPLRKRARHEQLSATANRFPCSDGKWIVLNMPEAFWWPTVAKALGKPAWAEDERFKEARDRYRAMDTLIPMMDEVFATRTRDEWGAIFDEHGVIWGPVLGLHEVAQDPQAEAIDLFPSLSLENDEGRSSYRTVRNPLRFQSADVLPERPSPALGADTHRVLEELGYGAAAIAELKKSKITS